MAKEFGFDLLQSQILDRLASELAAQADVIERVSNYGDTPIERLLLGSMFLSLKYLEQEFFTRIVTSSDDFMASRKEKLKAKNMNLFLGQNTIFVQKQTDVAGWRSDFVFNVYADWDREPDSGRKPGWDRLIVECDGHDFHERTKEQAARDRERDRASQIAGMEIYRFTGSELWRNPLGCAEQVIAWANKRV
jgi:hypothetical protein